MCFADDLLLFCHGNLASVDILLNSFDVFSKASGLKMNVGKSNVFLNGVDPAVQAMLIARTGMQLARLPFKYLGVPIATKKLSVLDCAVLVERVVCRIRALGARKLSYGGRLILVQAVLTQLHNYWARIFLLPKKVLKQIDDICRNFLWQGHSTYEKSPPVAWSKVCKDKAFGGLGIINSELWNIAAICKYVWWIATKKDHMWVKWVHNVYIKQKDWWTYQPPASASWAWKRICWVKDRMRLGFSQNGWGTGAAYSIQAGYSWLQNDHEKPQWRALVWTRYGMSKHNVIAWLAAQSRLLTRDRLRRRGVCLETICVLCENDSESHPHLFFACGYSRCCLQLVSNWLGIQIPWHLPLQWWVKWRMRPLLKKHIVGAAICVLIYQIWQARNLSLHEHYMQRPGVIVQNVKYVVCHRLKCNVSSVMKEKYSDLIRGYMS
ncbi:uncharacterized protein LOC141637629 [Silene latifolia]|uniref:uncharacterized protein LOC141637629 n=1 Tax=Silene latifolia TaxID=37657 RepID=UPI003D77A299